MLSTTLDPQSENAQRLDAARRDLLAWPTSSPRDLSVTRSEFAGIVAALADVPLPGRDDVESVASTFGTLTSSAQVNPWEGSVEEGRTWHLGLSAGVVSLRSFDAAKVDKAAQRLVSRRESMLRQVVAQAVIPGDGFTLLRDEELLPKAPFGAEVVAWSAKSRARMVKTLAQLDLSSWSADGGDLAMVTLTLPGDWQTVAPDGKTFKALVEKFRRRFVRATSRDWRCIWKLEFQRRGAPHMHLLMRVPALVKGQPFEQWLSVTWADVVAHPDPVERMKHEQAGTGVDYAGGRYRDPRRIALYFLGHSTKHSDGKEYQHIVPLLWQGRGKGPGRFWGYSGLSTAVVEVELTLREAMIVRRILRKVHANRTAQRDRARAARGLPPLPRRKVWTLGSSGSMSGGWVLSNDALALAYDLGRYLQGLRT